MADSTADAIAEAASRQIAAITTAANRQVAAALAAALLQMRGDASLQAVKDAYRDAYNSLYPSPNDPAYRTWAREAKVLSDAV
jgi:hypothetical protein